MSETIIILGKTSTGVLVPIKVAADGAVQVG